MSKTSAEKLVSTAKNKIRRIEHEIKLHPKVANNSKLLERLKFWKSKI